MDLSRGATRPKVTRATIPSSYSMHPLEKSGAMALTAMPLSGSWVEENAVTRRAGPKKAGSWPA